MKNLIGFLGLLLSACASAPQPYCLPPDMTRTSETSGPLGVRVPRPGASSEEYAECKEREADARLEDELRKAEALAKEKEAEQLARELREMKQRGEEPESGD